MHGPHTGFVGGGGGEVHCAESTYFYSVQTNTHEKGEASHKSPNVQKLPIFVVFCFLRFVMGGSNRDTYVSWNPRTCALRSNTVGGEGRGY